MDTLLALIVGFLLAPVAATLMGACANAALWVAGWAPEKCGAPDDLLCHPAFVWREDGGYINGRLVLSGPNR